LKATYTINYVQEIDSTNGYLQQLRKTNDLPEGYIVSAFYQKKGRGQTGNNWVSEAGKNITFSMNLTPRFLPAGDQFYLSMAVSLGIVHGIENFGVVAKIKWPNDILIHKRKICGILIENTVEGNFLGSVTIGAGVNVNQMNFPENIPHVTSLALELGKELNLDQVIHALATHILHYYQLLKNLHLEELKQMYLEKLFGYHESMGYVDDEGRFTGEIQDVLPTGELLVRRSDGKTRAYLFKEITYQL